MLLLLLSPDPDVGGVSGPYSVQVLEVVDDVDDVDETTESSVTTQT